MSADLKTIIKTESIRSGDSLESKRMEGNKAAQMREAAV
jgi:hypothetical protein